MRHDRSHKLFERAQQRIPGGVNSPVRAYKGVGGHPVFLQRGEGAFVYDADGNRYIDYIGSWGPLILGHAPSAVIDAINDAARDGTSFGAATWREVELAERVVQAVPSIDKVRFVNSGTEATMSALRLARGYTQRDRVIKFAGCYHGHGDAFLSESAGSGVATLGIPGCAGVPAGAASDTITVPYNDLDSVRAVLEGPARGTVAAIIVEPIACNMGMVKPKPGFLQGLRALCDEHRCVLIFDEVITGFRLGLGGAQGLYDVRPDLSTFGKIIGGGLPVGAYGGREDIMNCLAPIGPVYQAGTLSGNPIAMAAGIATLDALAKDNTYALLETHAASLERGMHTVLAKHNHPALFMRVGSIVYLWFKENAARGPDNYDEIKQADATRFGKFFHLLLEEGIMIAPSAFEVGFVSTAHTQQHIDATLSVVDRAFAQLG